MVRCGAVCGPREMRCWRECHSSIARRAGGSPVVSSRPSTGNSRDPNPLKYHRHGTRHAMVPISYPVRNDYHGDVDSTSKVDIRPIFRSIWFSIFVIDVSFLAGIATGEPVCLPFMLFICLRVVVLSYPPPPSYCCCKLVNILHPCPTAPRHTE